MMRTHYIADAKKEVGNKVEIAGWAHEVRDIGKVRFIILRDRTGMIQIFAKKGIASDDVFDKMAQPKETVMVIRGEVVASKIATGGVEIVPEKISIVGALSAKVPFDVTEKVPADLDVRLDARYVDLRRPQIASIFRIKSHVAKAFRDSLFSYGFDEIHPTCLVGAATEGGTELFEVQYFERKAYLAQSPQLYKQLAVIGGMDKVFMTLPVFRAEKHNTLTHLNEVLQMDAEMGFCDDKDAIDVLERTFLGILSHVEKNCKNELELLNSPITVPKKVPRYEYSELVDKLNAAGVKMEWGEDFDRDKEAKLQEILQDEAYFITRWPTKIRAFYSMPLEENPDVCKAFDLVYRGLEISSGAQRIHAPELLEKQLIGRGLNPLDFKFYVDAFRVGAPPHAGWSIGIERIVMKMCNLHNIREASMFPRDRHRLTP